MNMDINQEFLGRGWSFPPSFNPESASVNMVSSQEDIDQSLGILLSTSLGERIMQPEYGCDLRDNVFDAIDSSFKTFILELARTAILYHEPRIRILLIDLQTDQVLEGVLKILIEYEIRTSNSRFNFVFPFFVNEGNGFDVGTFSNL